MDIREAKQALDKVIAKARVHLYKPIQAAEILYRDRIEGDIDLEKLETYRNVSKRWRDVICVQFLGRTSTSSARYQDDIFNENALPPHILTLLGKENKQKGGIVEAYIYRRFAERFTQMNTGLDYCYTHDRTDFDVQTFLSLFWHEAGLRRSIDKIYEIVVFALFTALIDVLEIKVEISLNERKGDVLAAFEDFARMVINLSSEKPRLVLPAKVNRVGVTNASDRGLDMWANFGLAIQIKHLSLSEELAQGIVTAVSADRIVIVCKDSEEQMIVSLLKQIGWKARIQSIITESNLIDWYERALRGQFAHEIGDKVIQTLKDEIYAEFPSTDKAMFNRFFNGRGYHQHQPSHDGIWR